jgi:DNA-binding HxlR family transcriptional regulator
VLRDRLRELVEAQLVVQGADERYELTELGADLGRSLQPLTRWAQRWAAQLPAPPPDS